jgi:hypothetical protein
MTLPSNQLIPFLCYSKENKIVVREFFARLKKEGWIDPWFDEEDILPGEKWQDSVVKAVGGSHAVIVLLSKQALKQEGFFHKELNLALDTANKKPEDAIFIIPIRLEECEVPERLLPYQYVDYFGGAEQEQHVYDSLLASLKIIAQTLDISVIQNPPPSENPL